MTLSSTVCSSFHHDRLRVSSERRSPSASREWNVPTGVRAIDTAESGSAALSDEELLGRYRDARQQEDFAELYRRFAGELRRHLVRYVGDAAQGEDALQDAFLQVHAKCGLYRDDWPVRPWLYAVATHRTVDTMRRSRRLPTIRIDQARAGDELGEPKSLLEILAVDGLGPLEELQERERRRWVRESVAQLPESMREVVRLAYDRELSYAEIADRLGVPLSTVKSRLHCAIVRLRAMAEQYDRAGSC